MTTVTKNKTCFLTFCIKHVTLAKAKDGLNDRGDCNENKIGEDGCFEAGG